MPNVCREYDLLLLPADVEGAKAAADAEIPLPDTEHSQDERAIRQERRRMPPLLRPYPAFNDRCMFICAFFMIQGSVTGDRASSQANANC